MEVQEIDGAAVEKVEEGHGSHPQVDPFLVEALQNTRHRLTDEPGKQVRSAAWIKNTSKSHVAFKFHTTAPRAVFRIPRSPRGHEMRGIRGGLKGKEGRG